MRSCGVLAVQEVPREQTRQYDVVKGLAFSSALLSVEEIVEKPDAKVASSNLVVTGRSDLSPSIFASVRRQPRGAGGEIQLTDGIGGLLAGDRVHRLAL